MLLSLIAGATAAAIDIGAILLILVSNHYLE